MATLARPQPAAFLCQAVETARSVAPCATLAAPLNSSRSKLFPAAGAVSAAFQKDFFSGAAIQQKQQRPQRRAGRAALTTVSAARRSVLIVNTNSGGHAIIGFALARHLATAGHFVTILTVGDQSSDKMKKLPFSRFPELRAEGIRTVWGDPSRLPAVLGPSATFDTVLDNNGKDLSACKPVVDWAQAAGARQFLFISSAGIYKPSYQPPHVEGDAVKESAGHVEVERYVASKIWSDGWAAFRPQYITGEANNKDCEEWFFDRIVRGRPVPIPAPGLQLTVVAHVDDIARMITLAVDYPNDAAGGIFNAVGGRTVTFDGLARMCANAAGAGQGLRIVHYDPKAAGVDAKKAFPFRNQHFYSEPRNAREKLGFKSFTDLQAILNQRYSDYVASGRDKASIKFDLDDKILQSVSA